MPTKKARTIHNITTLQKGRLQKSLEYFDQNELKSNLTLDVDKMYPEELIIKNENDLYRRVQRGLDAIKAGHVYSLEETIAFTNSL